MYTYRCTHTDAHMQIHTYRCAHTDANIQMHTYTCTHTDEHVHIHMYTYTGTHTDVHIHMYTYTCTYTHVHIHMYTYTYTHVHVMHVCVAAIDWCVSDPCQRDMGGLCFLLDGGRTYKCQCKAGFKKITNGDSFMRCQGESVSSVILLYLQNP